MKKLFLFLAVSALTLTSCSSDDNGGGESVKFKIGGTSKSFKNLVANEVAGTILISGYNGPATDPTETINISIPSGETGDVATVYYSNETDDFYDDGSFTTNVTKNSNGSVKGTFSGTLEGFDSNIIIDNGSFEAKF